MLYQKCQPPQSILLVRLSALGDVTLMLPVVRTLQHFWPETKISWLIGRGAFCLLEGLTGVEFIVIDKPGSITDYKNLRQLFKKRQFDVLLATQASLRTNLIYLLINAKLKLGFDRQRARDGQWLVTQQRIPFKQQHLMDGFFSFIETLGLHEKLIRWDLPLGEVDHQWAETIIREFAVAQPLIAINPGASKKERNWSAAHYASVIKQAQVRWQACFVLTGSDSKVEQQLAQDIMTSLADHKVMNLVGKTTPKQLAALLQRVRLLIAPDTGPVHIAVAMGTPVIGLYAVAPPELSGPYLFQHLVINYYPEASKTILGKDPATSKWGTRIHQGKPMALIQPDDVIEKLEKLLG